MKKLYYFLKMEPEHFCCDCKHYRQDQDWIRRAVKWLEDHNRRDQYDWCINRSVKWAKCVLRASTEPDHEYLCQDFVDMDAPGEDGRLLCSSKRWSLFFKKWCKHYEKA